jgi:hypothetical protein
MYALRRIDLLEKSWDALSCFKQASPNAFLLAEMLHVIKPAR